jgi:hypothetical protein
MSATASWSYTNTATIRPRLSVDDWTGEVTYGPEYTIACTWAAEATQQRDMGGQGGANGAEFISRHIIYTEDRRPQYLDLIQFDGSNGWEEIRTRTEWDMSFFDEEPDVKLIT